MYRYLLSRVIQAVLTVFVLSLIVFLLARVLGDPIAFMLPFDALPEDIDRIRQQLGFDRPLFQQYMSFLMESLRGDLGLSTRQAVPVTSLIGERAGPSFLLVGSALGLALALGIPLGVVAAVKKDTFGDRLARGIAIFGQSAPPFWVGIMLIQLFSLEWRLFPSAGIGGIQHLVLPAFTMSLLAIAGVTRLVRSGMLDVLDSEFIKKARIIGMPEWQVIWKHAFRNATIPVLTFAAEYFGILIAAAVVVETVFVWPGLGRLAYEAVFTRDYPLIQGVILIMAGIVLMMNLAVDLIYAVIDPRIRYGAA